VANEAAAERHAATVLPIIRDIKRAGARTLREIAEALNARGVQTARGGQWYAMTVSAQSSPAPTVQPQSRALLCPALLEKSKKEHVGKLVLHAPFASKGGFALL
jgi:hypothetical protein